MEPIIFTIVVIAYFLKSGKVDTAAYNSGKEPPNVVKARLRHEAGGGRRDPKTNRPRGPGAFRLLARSRWANACAAAQQRGDHRAQRKRQWYDDNRDRRDEAWRAKRLRRLERAEAIRGHLAQRFTGAAKEPQRQATPHPEPPRPPATSPPVDPENTQPRTLNYSRPNVAGPNEPAAGPPSNPAPEPQDSAERSDTSRLKRDEVSGPKVDDTTGTSTQKPENPAQPTNGAVPPPIAPPPAAPPPAPGDQPSAGARPDSSAEPKAEQATGNQTSTSTTNGTEGMYQQGVNELNRAADHVATFNANLAQFADELAGRKWGVEVTGTLQDLTANVSALQGIYRDLAGSMKQQGDEGAAAYEQAPYVPGPEAVLA